MSILRHTEAEDRAAWIFLRWLTEREQTARWAAISGYFPVRISASTHVSMTTKLATDPQYAQAQDLLPLARSEPSFRGYAAIRTLLASAMTDILQDGADVPSTLEAAANQANIDLAQAGPESSVISPAGGTLVYSGTQGTRVEYSFPQALCPKLKSLPMYLLMTSLPTDLPLRCFHPSHSERRLLLLSSIQMSRLWVWMRQRSGCTTSTGRSRHGQTQTPVADIAAIRLTTHYPRVSATSATTFWQTALIGPICRWSLEVVEAPRGDRLCMELRYCARRNGTYADSDLLAYD